MHAHVHAHTVNPNDLTGGVPKKVLDLHFDVKFDGINLSLLEKKAEIVHTGVTGEAARDIATLLQGCCKEHCVMLIVEALLH